MYELKIVSGFAAAHQLRGYEGVCEHLHGHNWKVEVYVQGDELDNAGLLIDFKLLKKATQQVLERLDHSFLNDAEMFSVRNPSSENIARYVFMALSEKINTERIRVSRVIAWESDNSCAAYSEP